MVAINDMVIAQLSLQNTPESWSPCLPHPAYNRGGSHESWVSAPHSFIASLPLASHSPAHFAWHCWKQLSFNLFIAWHKGRPRFLFAKSVHFKHLCPFTARPHPIFLIYDTGFQTPAPSLFLLLSKNHSVPPALSLLPLATCWSQFYQLKIPQQQIVFKKAVRGHYCDAAG